MSTRSAEPSSTHTKPADAQSGPKTEQQKRRQPRPKRGIKPVVGRQGVQCLDLSMTAGDGHSPLTPEVVGDRDQSQEHEKYEGGLHGQDLASEKTKPAAPLVPCYAFFCVRNIKV